MKHTHTHTHFQFSPLKTYTYINPFIVTGVKQWLVTSTPPALINGELFIKFRQSFCQRNHTRSKSLSNDKNIPRFHSNLLSLFISLLILSRFFLLAKMASTSSVGCSLHATLCYRTEQAMSMVMDSQSLNALAVDSGSEKVSVSSACSQWPSQWQWCWQRLFARRFWH